MIATIKFGRTKSSTLVLPLLDFPISPSFPLQAILQTI